MELRQMSQAEESMSYVVKREGGMYASHRGSLCPKCVIALPPTKGASECFTVWLRDNLWKDSGILYVPNVNASSIKGRPRDSEAFGLTCQIRTAWIPSECNIGLRYSTKGNGHFGHLSTCQ